VIILNINALYKRNKIINSLVSITRTDQSLLTPFLSEKKYSLNNIINSEISNLINNIEHSISNKNYQEIVLKNSPKISHYDHHNGGSFLSYDFHITSNGPKLIEINTNAGGALLFSEYLKIKYRELNEKEYFIKFSKIQNCFIDMLTNEFKLQFPNKKLKTVAIVDLKPLHQPLLPELNLFRKYLRSINIEAFILDPEELTLQNNEIYYDNIKIDLIYNRLTDFYFEEHYSRKIKTAYLLGTVSVTPNPRYHALYASKSNLSIFSNKNTASNFHFSDNKVSEFVKKIPFTTLVTSENSSELWFTRRNLFFKPTSGYGGKAVYRGKGITKKVWRMITRGNYVAQKYIPAEIKTYGNKSYKSDLRAYVYLGEILFLAARLYNGQTTNFSSKGGGFAEVVFNNSPVNFNKPLLNKESIKPKQVIN
jgi:glutathione synthase/RimK-type ligase-like ATP-grasp enzyme